MKVQVRLSVLGHMYGLKQKNRDTLGALGFKHKEISFYFSGSPRTIVKSLTPSTLGQIRCVFKYLKVEILETGRTAQEIGELERLLQPEAMRGSQERSGEYESGKAGSIRSKGSDNKGPSRLKDLPPPIIGDPLDYF